MSLRSWRAPLSASRSAKSGDSATDGGARKLTAGDDPGAAGAARAMDSHYDSRDWTPEVGTNGITISGRKSPRKKGPQRLLTLPTIFTIGRVVAVPILVSNETWNSIWCIFGSSS